MSITLAEESFRRTYHANCCSSAAIFCCIMYVLIFLVPFLLGNLQHNLWRGRYGRVDPGKISFNGNAILMADDKGFAVYNSFLQTLDTNQFTSSLLSSEAGTTDTNEIDIKLRVLTSSPTFEGELYIFVNYNSNSTDLKYLNFTDVIMVPVRISPQQNLITVIGTYYLDQNQQYSLQEAIENKYVFDTFEQYKKSLNILNVFNKRLSNPFKISASFNSYTSPAAFDGFEVRVQLMRDYRYINRSPSLAAVLRNTWPVYLGLFIPVALFLRFIMREAYRFRLFQVTTSIRLPSGHFTKV